MVKKTFDISNILFFIEYIIKITAMENDSAAATEEVTSNGKLTEENNVENTSSNFDNNPPANDDEDEFGDFAEFESAPQPQTSDGSMNGENINSSTEKFGNFDEFKSSQNEVISPQVNLPSLGELLSDNSIFCIEEDFNHINGSEVGVKIYDLLKECDKEDTEISKGNSLFTNIWKDLRIVEETRALGFSLAKSQSYNSFLGALQMSAKKVIND